MLFALTVVAVFILSFIVVMGLYLLLVKTKLIRKKRIEKLFRLMFIYSVFTTLVYIFQYMFM